MSAVLIVSFVAYFAWQFALGVDIDNPSAYDLLSFGANYLLLTVTIEPYRLFTSGFLHIGLMHLLFNSFALYYFGRVAEPLVGSKKLLCVFLASVLAGNLLNLWHGFLSMQIGLSAGASGGIMGIGALLTVLSLSPRYPFLSSKNLLVVMAINLLLGFAVPGIDNAGHIGGAVMGAVLGGLLLCLTAFFWWGVGLIIVLLGGVYYLLYIQVHACLMVADCATRLTL